MKLVHGNRRQRVVASEKQRGLTRKGHKRGLWGITGISVSCLGEHHVRTLQWKIQDLSFLLYVNDNSLKLKKKKIAMPLTVVSRSCAAEMREYPLPEGVWGGVLGVWGGGGGK